MKNYTYGWHIESQGYKEVSEDNYTLRQADMNAFIKSISSVIELANCGWDNVQYKVMKHVTDENIKEYMVLYCGGYGARWIPIDGNSKGCNFSVLGENLW